MGHTVQVSGSRMSLPPFFTELLFNQLPAGIAQQAETIASDLFAPLFRTEHVVGLHGSVRHKTFARSGYETAALDVDASADSPKNVDSSDGLNAVWSRVLSRHSDHHGRRLVLSKESRRLSKPVYREASYF
jgi:hypothetical protein